MPAASGLPSMCQRTRGHVVVVDCNGARRSWGDGSLLRDGGNYNQRDTLGYRMVGVIIMSKILIQY